MKIILFTSHSPRIVTRLIQQIEREVPEARVQGILYQTPARNSVLDPKRSFALRILRGGLGALGTLALRFIHACPARPNGRLKMRLKDLAEFCRARQCSLLVARDLSSDEAKRFVRGQNADLGIIYGTQSDALDVFALPREGSIVLDRGPSQDAGETAPAGLAELSKGQSQITVSVRRFVLPPDGQMIASTTLPIDPYDTLLSLELKTQVVGNDLLAQAVGQFARGAVREEPPAQIENQAAPAPRLLQTFEGRDKFAHLFFRSMRCWPDWKLLLKCGLFLPVMIARNWYRRLRGRVPVIILYHHLVSDRAHYLGIPTEIFYRQVEFLLRHYRVATLEEATAALRLGKLRAPTVVLTFDDGYRENFVNLRAVTEQTGVPVSLFISTDYMNSRTPFGHDQKRLEFGFPPLDWEQVAMLGRSGLEIGSHTRTHFDCGSNDPVILEREIVGSKQELEQRLGQPVKFFSFPWGQPKNMSPTAVEIARSAYPFVFSAFGGENYPTTNGSTWHLLRRNHFNDLWECEMEIQAILQR
jgi:peptidoglycan/xylan/chitin deacetylase (PgdA/CDA1 family)